MATKNKKTAKKKSTPKKTVQKTAPRKVTKISAAKKSVGKKSAAPKKAIKSFSKPKASAKVISLSEARETRLPKVDWSLYLTPIDDRVLVELEKPAEKTAGGLFIPDSAQQRSNNGKVVAVGPGKRDKKGRRKRLDVRVGEKIMYVDYAGSKLELEGRNLLLISESEILGIIEP